MKTKGEIHSGLIKCSLPLVSILIFLFLLEIVLALFRPHKITANPFLGRSFFCRYHPLMGWVNKPNYKDIFNVAKDFRFTVTHNSRGLRGPERGYRKPSGVKRVIALGDSFVWGFGVEDDEVFSRVIESADPHVEVINMGVSGYGTDQQILYYDAEGAKYEHDLVLVLFYANDISELGRTISYGYPKPMFNPDSKKLTLMNVPVPRTTETERKLYGNPSTALGKFKKFLRRNTHTYPFLAGRLNSVPWMRRFFLKTGLAEEYTKALPGIPYFFMKDPKRKWEMFFRLIKEFRVMSHENGADLVLINIPIKETPPGDILEYEAISGNENRENDKISAILERFTSENGIRFINMLGPIRKGQAKGIAYYAFYKSDVHLNAEGHKLLAEIVVERLLESGWTKRDL